MPASVRKAALVLDLFSVEHPHWGPSEVARELGIAKSTAHALLAELTSVGMTERLPCGRYRLGWRTVGLARTMLATSPYRDAVMPTARELASHFGETVHLTAWERGRVLYVASERPPGGVTAPLPRCAPATARRPPLLLSAHRAAGSRCGVTRTRAHSPAPASASRDPFGSSRGGDSRDGSRGSGFVGGDDAVGPGAWRGMTWGSTKPASVSQWLYSAAV